tara:strand:- start:20 stop:250 length:231 start_codon:yes stop_codon:yes gene_type:complete
MKFDWLKRQLKRIYKRYYAVCKSDGWVSTHDKSEVFILYTNEPPFSLQNIFGYLINFQKLRRNKNGKEIFSGAVSW